ncbi:homoserine kinase [Bacillus alveayuensis]|jgi:homoserine kinase|uniref:homoserine kinase n=1 Tax=Aeribacillus alveayuensis TaxID=279215 RepID=UPI0005CCBBAB|nr:homoserine kinase [Bacillus alveayuensis]
MKEGEMLKIRVPGSTANLGPGFDSIGLALNRYLTLSISPSHQWFFEPLSQEVQDIPKGEENLIYKVAASLAEKYGKDLPPCHVKVESNIPMARGLGSSAAAIAAGIELANQLGNLQLSEKEKLHFASTLEGHPDNAGASLLGGLVIGLIGENETDLVKIDDVQVDIVAVIPPYYLYTSDSRNALPKEFRYQDAVKASAISNLLVASIIQNNWELAGKMMELDLFHQPYRSKLVPELLQVQREAKQLGAYGTVLSGAGPTILTFAPKGMGDFIAFKLQKEFDHCEVTPLFVERKGAQVFYERVENHT